MSLDDQLAKPRSEYKEFLPPAPLAAHFMCFWSQTITGAEGAYEHRVLPDGCIDIVFIDNEPPTVVGPWTVSFVARFAVGTAITGARLHPGRAPSLLGMAATELLNHAIPVAIAKGAVQHMPLEKVIEQPNAQKRRSALAQVLFASIGRSAPFDQAILASVRWLSRHPKGCISELSRSVGISERQLHRRFSAAIGYGPKMFQSILRFQRLLKIARETDPEHSLPDLAAQTGYADQAHMTRDVHRLANLRPTELLRSADCTLQMSELFKT